MSIRNTSKPKKTVKRLRISCDLHEQLNRAANVYRLQQAEIIRRALRYYARRRSELSVTVRQYADTTTYQGAVVTVRVPEELDTDPGTIRAALRYYLSLQDFQPRHPETLEEARKRCTQKFNVATNEKEEC